MLSSKTSRETKSRYQRRNDLPMFVSKLENQVNLLATNKFYISENWIHILEVVSADVGWPSTPSRKTLSFLLLTCERKTADGKIDSDELYR